MAASRPTPDRTVAMFWDVENLPVPRDLDAAALGSALQEFGRSLSVSQNLEFVNVYVDSSRLGSMNANRLSQVGINLIHSQQAKEAADKQIILDLMLWLLIFERHHAGIMPHLRPEPCVVLVSQDHDFLPLCSKLRNQRGIHVVLLTNFQRVQPHFISSANEAFDWAQVVGEAWQIQENGGGPSRRQSLSMHSSTSSNSSFGADCAEFRESKPINPTAVVGTKALKKRFSSIHLSEKDSIEDQIANFCSKVLQSKRRVTTDVLLEYMKNPGVSDGLDMYLVGTQDFGRRLEEILRLFPNKFELTTNRRSQKTWVTSREEMVSEVPAAPDFAEPKHFAHESICCDNVSPNLTQLPPPPKPWSLPSHDWTSSSESQDRAGATAWTPSRLQRQPSDWTPVLNENLEEEGESLTH